MAVLTMEQVGTFCIACAILTLPDVGPRDQPGQVRVRVRVRVRVKVRVGVSRLGVG